MNAHLAKTTATPIEVLRGWAQDQPGKRLFTAVLDDPGGGSEGLTYAGLDRRARAIGARLRSLGLDGGRALLLFAPGLDFVAGFFGCLYAGVVAVPASPGRPNRPMDRLRGIASDARPDAVLTSAALLAEADRWSGRVAELAGLPWLAVDAVDEGLAEDWRDPGSGPETLAFLQYTSGSTAAPKGVMITHGNLAHNSAVIRDCFGTDSDSVGVFWLPLHHDMGLIGGVLQTIHCGGSSTLLTPSAFLQRPLRWLELISATGAAISGGPNFAFDLCARKATPAQVAGLDLGRWRVAFNGAEPVRAETLDRFARAFGPAGFRREAFLPCYGMAETTLLVSGGPWRSPPVVLPVDPSALGRNEVAVVADPGPAGGMSTRSLAGSGRVAGAMEVVIADPESGELRLGGRVGEIWVSGPSVAAGYWGQPEETDRAFGARLAGSGAGPYLRTGDLGVLHDGELFVTGRVKDLIILGGRNVYPQDIEWAAQQAHPALRPDAGAAFSIEVDGQERLAVVQEVERHARGQAKEAIRAIRKAVAEQWDLPVHAVALIRPMSLPRTSSGKVRRRDCREQLLAGTLDPIEQSLIHFRETPIAAASVDPEAVAGPAGPAVRDWLVARLSGMLGIEATEVDPRREFAAFGLGSMQAARLAGELEEWLDRPISPTLVYEYPTIEALSGYLAGEPAAAPTAPGGGNPPGRVSDEPIAVIGIGCRFPGADGPEAFWRLLAGGVDAVGTAPEGRRSEVGPAGLRGGFLAEVDRFDADFFGISAREAARIDPQQRILLEVAWEALEDAGQAPERLAGEPVGVFVGISTNDYGLLQLGRGGPGDVHALTGNASSIAANRISYAFDFRGPSLAVDTACSSSLVAVHLACRSLRAGEASLALAGGVNLTLAPEVAANLARAGFLAADGRCKAFDSRADGYVRGEGAGLVVLKPLSAARLEGDPIYAVILGGAINQDGRSNGLTAPSPRAQEVVLRDACRASGIEPGSLDYVEAHGTGTLLGDPIEAGALGAVVGRGRAADRPCLVGSVKTNIGHLEAAAGISGLIKVALSLRHRAIPASLHLSEPNPQIGFEELRLRVPRGLEAWPVADSPPRAGVSSFGFGGSNAHLVLEGVDPTEGAAADPTEDAQLLPLSARDPDALLDLARSVRGFLAERTPGIRLVDVASSAAARKGHHDHRLALVVRSKEEAIAGLDAFLRGDPYPGLSVGRRGATLPSLTFLLPDPAGDLPAPWRSWGIVPDAVASRLDPTPEDGGLRIEIGADAGRAGRFESLAALYVAGFSVDWRGVYPSGSFVKLPPYPWRRGRHWLGPRDDDAPAVGTVEELLHEVQWPPEAREPAPTPEVSGRWLIFADSGGIGRALASRLEAGGADCLLVHPGEPGERGPSEVAIDPADPAGYRGLLERAIGRAPARGIVHLWGLDLAAAEPSTVAELEAGQVRACGSVLILVGALADRGGPSSAGLRVVTRGAQPVGPSRSSASPLAATAWGLGRSIALGHPGLWGGLIDLDPEAPAGEVDALFAEVAGPDRHREVAFRGGLRHVARLARRGPLDGADRPPFALRPEGTYLVTGGLGVLGLRSARWLAERGARRLVLVGRRGLPGRSAWDNLPANHPAQAPIAAVREIERLGASVVVAAADVADPDAVGALIDRLRDLFPPVRGIVHAAGVVPAGLERDADLAGLLATLRPKVAGTWVLDRATRHLPLDFFVGSSSMASVVGAREASYCAANAYLDAFAHHSARPVLSVNWGPWGGGGMAADPDRARAHRLLGLSPLDPDRALAALGHLLTTGARQAIVADVDWPTLGAHRGEAGSGHRLDPAGIHRPGPGSTADVEPTVPGWRTLPPDRRRPWLVEFLRARVADALELTPEAIQPEVPLTTLGVDSLTAFEIKFAIEDGLKVSLPASVFVEGPSVARLADAVAGLVEGSEGGRGATGPPLPISEEARSIMGELRAVPADSARGAVPASSAQGRLWFLHQLEPASPAYNITAAVRLLGALDVAAMGRAFAEVVRRHEALRTTFGAIDGQPVQVIAEAAELPFPVADLTDLAGSWRDREVAARLAEEAARPFDLAAGPLVRAGLLRLGPAEHVVVLNLHHIVADGLSMAILIGELAGLYDAFSRGLASPLPPPAMQYADFAAWQADRLGGPALRDELDYWRARLDAVPALELPTDRPRPAQPTRRAGTRRATLPPELMGELAELGRSQGATPFMTLLAAFQALMHRYSGQVDFAVGTPIAGRPRAEFAPMIGLFVNSLALRADLSGGPGFRELLARVRRTATESYHRQELPFEQVVSALQPDRGAGHSPLFQVMFVHQEDPLGRRDLPGLTLEPIEIEAVAAKFDLTLFAIEAAGGLRLALEYDADLYDASTADRMLGHYRILLEAAVADPDRPVESLPILAAAERHLLLREWNATEANDPRDAPVHRLFERQAERTPGAVAVRAGDQSLTYRELDRRANRLAHHLRSLGVGPDVLVGVCLGRSPELVVGLLGILKAGGAYLPLDPAYPAGRLGSMMADSGASVLLTHSDLRDRIARPPARIVLADGDWAEADGVSDSPPTDGSGPDNLAYVIYTSGSTGRPKGAMIVHRGLTNYLSWCVGAYRAGEGQGAPVHSSISFDLTVTSLFAPLISGSRVDLIAEDLGVEALAEALRRGGDYSLVKITPAHLQLLGQQLAPGEAPGRARTFVVGGEQLTGEHLAFWREHSPESVVVNEYGPTEAVVGCCAHRTEPGDRATGPVPIGRPIANTRLYILDPRMEPTPIGVPGELFIGGDGVARGYLGRPGPTALAFVPDPFGPPGGRLYRTGDRARWRPEGRVEFLGRSDDQVKIRGYRVELGEVEAALTRHPEVREAAVVARRDNAGDRRLVGYVSAQAGRAIDPAQLRRDLARGLPAYMIPSAIVTLETLPLTANGKVDRAALPEPDGSRGGPVLDTPTGPIEEILCRIVAGVLKLDAVGARENLFDLGIDSILVIQVVSRARQAGLRLQPGHLFRHPSVAELARVVEPVPTTRSEPGPGVGPVPLTPIQRRFFEQGPARPHHDNQALLLEIPPTLSADRIEAALADLVDHHDALRLRFARSEAGWSQHAIAPGDQAVALDRFDLAALDDTDRTQAVEAESARLQAALDIEAGPIFRAAHFDFGPDRPSRLLLAIHHLAVDGVSWRILLEDLASVLAQRDRGAEPDLPPRTTSVRHWAECLDHEAGSATTLAERDYWLAQARGFVAPLPVDSTEARGPGIEAEAGVVSMGLDEEATRALLHEVPRAFHSQINDALLTALGRALAGWAGAGEVQLDLEGHGREEIADGVDLSRTVGWFTTVYPVRLELPRGGDMGATMRSVKEQLRRVPRRGIGYGLLRYPAEATPDSEALGSAPRPEVAFNYLGQLDRAIPGSSGFALAAESPGPSRAAGLLRSHLLDVVGRVVGGRFGFAWTYHTRVHRRETIEGLAAAFVEELLALIEAARSPEVRGYVPSDFPLSGLDQATLDRAFGSERGIEDVYPLSPMQEGMLYDAAYADGSGAYLQQWTCVFRGDFEADAFASAWQQVVARHPALRTSFQWVDADRPMQVVHRQVEFSMEEVDWRAVPPEEQDRRLGSYLQADRRRGFVLSWAPLMRLALIRLGPEAARVVFSFHHAILDGWGMPILFEEVLTLYEAGRLGREAALPPSRPYRDFIAWLGEQDASHSRAYWRETLRGFRAPTSLGIDRPGPAERGRAGSRGEQVVRLPAAATAALNALARAEQITLNTLVQGAWALLLARYSGQTDVVFGVTVSGRQADLPGLPSMIGLFINTLPARVPVLEESALLPWLRQIQARQAEMREHEQTPLVQVQGWSEVPRGRPLFESIVVFENYPRDVAAEGRLAHLRFEPGQVLERTNFPFTLMVGPDEELRIRADYDADRYDDPSIDRLLDHFRTLLGEIAADPGRRLADLPMIGPAEQEQLLGLSGGDPARDDDGLDIDLEATGDEELDLLLLRLTEEADWPSDPRAC